MKIYQLLLLQFFLGRKNNKIRGKINAKIIASFLNQNKRLIVKTDKIKNI